MAWQGVPRQASHQPARKRWWSLADRLSHSRGPPAPPGHRGWCAL